MPDMVRDSEQFGTIPLEHDQFADVEMAGDMGFSIVRASNYLA